MLFLIIFSDKINLARYVTVWGTPCKLGCLNLTNNARFTSKNEICERSLKSDVRNVLADEKMRSRRDGENTSSKQ